MEKEVPEPIRKAIIKKKYSKIIENALNSEPDQQELYSIVRNFFSEYLKTEYEFTYEELSLELEKAYIKPAMKKEIDGFLAKLSESEYVEDYAIPKDEVLLMLKQFKEMVNILIKDISSEKKQTFIEKILRIDKQGILDSDMYIPQEDIDGSKNASKNVSFKTNVSTDEQITSDTAVTTPIDSSGSVPTIPDLYNIQKTTTSEIVLEDESDAIRNIRVLMEQAYASKDDPDNARGYYKDALRLYRSMDNDSKKQVFLELNQLFIELKQVENNLSGLPSGKSSAYDPSKDISSNTILKF